MRDAIRAGELVRQVHVPAVRARDAGSAEHGGAESDPAHHLDPARDAGVDGAGGDEPGDEVVGLLRRSALAVDRRHTRRLRQPGVQPGVAPDVARLLAALRHAPRDDLLDFVRFDAGASDDLALHVAEGERRMQPCQPAVALPDGCADRLDDHGFGHATASRNR